MKLIKIRSPKCAYQHVGELKSRHSLNVFFFTLYRRKTFNRRLFYVILKKILDLE